MKVKISAAIFFMLASSAALAGEMTADQIVQKMNDLMNVQTMQGTVRMTIVTSSGEDRTFEYESYSRDRGEKNLIRYTAPKRARGQAMLMLNNADDIWAYFPRTRRVRKLATHAKRQKMEGSDFSYEDMGSGDAFIKEYTSSLLGEEKKEGEECYRLLLERLPESDAGYSRLVIWVIKRNFVPVVIDYYDIDDPELLKKSLVQYDIKIIDGIPTGTRVVMYNRLDSTSTSMELLDVKYNVQLEEEIFTERSLKR